MLLFLFSILASEGQKPLDNYRRITNLYEASYLPKSTAVEFCLKLRASRDWTQDARRYGRPSTSNLDNNKRAVKAEILQRVQIMMRRKREYYNVFKQ